MRGQKQYMNFLNWMMMEMTKALNEGMKVTSAPGVDGFTVNFIRKFWDSLGN